MPRKPDSPDARHGFPDPSQAGPDGLVAVGGDLSPERLLLAYRSGLFPWTVKPITWWSPDPRGVIEPGSLHVSRSLARTIRQERFTVTRDRAFRDVIEACASERSRGNWITPEFIDAYHQLHRLGHAHSVECWADGKLAGGVYGVSVGGLFAGESMFHRVSDGSKVALFHLHGHLRQRGFVLFDIQMVTPITGAMGAIQIPRKEYLRRLAAAVTLPCTWEG